VTHHHGPTAIAGAALLAGLVAMSSQAAAQSTRQADLIVVARLVRRAATTAPDCGILHCAEIMEYEVLRVERGTYTSRRIFVALGCPEMPRTMYGADAGSVQQLTVSDVHRLELSRTLPTEPGGPRVCAGQELLPPGQSSFWVLKADPASP
jgi:hypothetical protein